MTTLRVNAINELVARLNVLLEEAGGTPIDPTDPPAALARTIGHPDSWYNTPVTDLPVHPNSAAIMAQMQTALVRDHNWGLDGSGGQYWFPRLDFNLSQDTATEEGRYGHIVNVITPEIASEVTWGVPSGYNLDGPYDPHSDYVQVPYHPTFAVQEFGQSADNHLYVVDLSDPTAPVLRELYLVQNYETGDFSQITIGNSAIYDLSAASVGRGLGCTSPNAAGAEYAPFVVTAEDFAAQEINHAVAMTLPNDVPEGWKFIEPGQHSPLQYDTGGFLPYGARFRLRADFDVTGVGTEHTRTLLQAMKTYGFYHIDGTTGDQQIPSMNDVGRDTKWSSLANFNAFALWFYPGLPTWADFEMIDGTEHDMRTAPCDRDQIDERPQGGETLAEVRFPNHRVIDNTP
ncbi:MAG: hypothetical protein AAF628_08245 [Planctomycetota bacterium]